MKVNPEHAPNPRECLLHGWYSEQYGAEPFAIDLWEVQLFLRVSRPTASTMPARMLELGLLRRLEDGRYLVAHPVPQDAPAPQEAVPASKPKATPKPKAAPPNPLYVQAIHAWHNHLLAINGVGYKPTNPQAQGVAMKGILDQFRQLIANKEACDKIEVTDDAILHAWSFLISKWGQLEPFHQKTDLTMINKYLGDILNTIKNGTATRKGQRPGNNLGAILSTLEGIN